MMRPTILTQKTTLEEVRQRFEQWRGIRKRATPIPEDLWEGAVSLCADLSINQVSRQLGLEYNRLKKRVGTLHPERLHPSKIPTFVEMDFKPPPVETECLLEREDKTGGKVKMYIKGPLSIHPLEWVKAFGELWR